MSGGVRIIMFGRQGAGKGTQSARLAQHFGVPHISTGEMLRNAVKQDSVVGRAAKKVLDRGELVDDDLMVSLVQGRVGESASRVQRTTQPQKTSQSRGFVRNVEEMSFSGQMTPNRRSITDSMFTRLKRPL